MKRAYFLWGTLLLVAIMRYFWFTHIMPAPELSITYQGHEILKLIKSQPEDSSLSIKENQIVFKGGSVYELEEGLYFHPTGSHSVDSSLHFDLIGTGARGTFFVPRGSHEVDFMVSPDEGWWPIY